MYNRIVRRGDVFYADLGNGVGSEQIGNRPVVVIQNNKGNKNSKTIIVAAITSVLKANHLPVHVKIHPHESNLKEISVVMTEQIRTIDKKRLKNKVSTLSDNTMKKIDKAIIVSLFGLKASKNIDLLQAI